jgi:hypothetical protein
MVNQELEEKILGFTNKAKNLLESNEPLGYRFLRQATNLYHVLCDTKNITYMSKIEHTLNLVWFSYIDKIVEDR